MFDKLFKPSDMLQTGLSASWTRNAVIRNNLANAETPGFKASDVEFESLFKQAIQSNTLDNKTTREKHIKFNQTDPTAVTPRIVNTKGTSMRKDGNNVDIESENVKLAQNSLQYNTIMYKLNSELARLKLAVSEGR